MIAETLSPSDYSNYSSCQLDMLMIPISRRAMPGDARRCCEMLRDAGRCELPGRSPSASPTPLLFRSSLTPSLFFLLLLPSLPLLASLLPRPSLSPTPSFLFIILLPSLSVLSLHLFLLLLTSLSFFSYFSFFSLFPSLTPPFSLFFNHSFLPFLSFSLTHSSLLSIFLSLTPPLSPLSPIYSSILPLFLSLTPLFSLTYNFF